MVPGDAADSTRSIEDPSLDDLLVAEGGVAPAQVERARRIAARMRDPRPVPEILVELGQLTRSECDRLVRLHRGGLDIVRILLEEEALDAAAYRAFEEERARAPHRSDRDILVEGQLVSEERFLRALAAKHDVPYLEPEAALIENRLLTRVSFPYLLRNNLLPFRVVDNALTVVMANPLDTARIKELETIYGMEVCPCASPTALIQKAIRTAQERMQRGSPDGEEGTTRLNYTQIHAVAEGEEIGAEAVRIVDFVLYRAIELGASDIHVEPREKGVVVRVRVDGVLQPLTELPGEFAARIAARIKVLCNADLAERRLHQDGRIFARIDDREVDMRVSTYASVFGETVVIRILDRKNGLVALENLGFEAGIVRVVRDVALRTPTGLMLVTGPTGSGKTTTLYSFIDSMLDGTLKVITCEDPVEYVLAGVTQCQVNHKSGPSFPDSLRAMLRQDPDVIVVGEVRDHETATLAVEAALTGHKVLTSFHAEDTVSTVIRLLEMEIEPYLVSSTLSCILAQRLVRRLCAHCAVPTPPAPRDLRYLGLSREAVTGVTFMAGPGCEKCNGSGYRGRLGIHELLLPSDEFREAILRRAPARELRILARNCPAFLSLQEDGLLKAATGRTSLTEVVNNAPRDVATRPLRQLRDIASRKSFS
jgi:type IV pilus assembly protein PilB